MGVCKYIYPGILPLNAIHAIAVKPRLLYLSVVTTRRAKVDQSLTNRVDAGANASVVDETLTWAIVKMLLKERSELLKQFDEFTAATSSGRAKVISTHLTLLASAFAGAQ
jgi:hypothetical protein